MYPVLLNVCYGRNMLNDVRSSESEKIIHAPLLCTVATQNEKDDFPTSRG